MLFTGILQKGTLKVGRVNTAVVNKRLNVEELHSPL